MKKAFLTIKSVSAALLILAILSICYLVLLSPKEKRFYFAERTQGSFLSQMIFDVLIFQDASFSNAYFEKSVAFNKRGHYARGFELLNRAVELDPKLHLGYRGWLKLHKVKDYQGCIDDLSRLDTLTPNFVDVAWGDNIHYLLGLAYKGLKKYDLALIEFDKYIKSENDSSWLKPNVFLHLGIIYYRKENYKKTIETLMALKKANHGNLTPEYCYWTGIALKKLLEIDSSRVLLKKSKELYLKGLKHRDIYNAVQDELYLSDIESVLNVLR